MASTNGHIKGTRTLTLGTKTFEVSMRLGQIMRFDAAVVREKGPEADRLMDIVQRGKVDLWDLAHLFYEAVRGQHGIATVDEAADYLSDYGAALGEVTEVLFGAANDWMIVVEEEPGKKPVASP